MVQQLALPTPIVFVNISDPIGTGVLSNSARPGGRATSFTNFEASMAEKWLELLKQVAPSIERFGILGNTQSPSSSMFARSIEGAAKAICLFRASLGLLTQINALDVAPSILVERDRQVGLNKWSALCSTDR
jgi:ABC-type uncharacterized transport system substrate-binding protein